MASRPARALQLRLAARALRLTPEGGSHGARVALEWSALGSLTAQALAAHATAAHAHARPELAAALADLVSWTSPPNTSDGGSERNRNLGRRRGSATNSPARRPP